MRVTVVAQGWMPELRIVDIQPDMQPEDFQLRPGKTLRIKFVDSKIETDRKGSPLETHEAEVTGIE